MTIYKSKIGSLFIVIVIILSILAIESAYEQTWGAFIILSIVFAFFLQLLYSTHYKIEGKLLQVKSSIFINLCIDISTISKITPTNSLISASAISMDRLEIIYGHDPSESIMVSPSDKSAFLEQLLQINPNIKVEKKKS